MSMAAIRMVFRRSAVQLSAGQRRWLGADSCELRRPTIMGSSASRHHARFQHTIRIATKTPRPVHPRAERRGAGRRARAPPRARRLAPAPRAAADAPARRRESSQAGPAPAEGDDAPRYRPRARRAAAPDRRAARFPPQPKRRGRTRRHQRGEGPRRRAKTNGGAPAHRGNAAPGARSSNASASSFDLRRPRRRRTAARNWRLAVDAQVANRASRLSAAIADAGAMYLPERLHAVRIAMKKLRYALRTVDRAGRRKERRRPECAEARPGSARPYARPAGADRARAAGAGVADAAERDHLARSGRARRVARGRLPAAPRALHAARAISLRRSPTRSARRHRVASPPRGQARRAG